MIHLRVGDKLPIVAACQLLLNATRPELDAIAVDGIFGPQTRGAVERFRDESKLSKGSEIDPDTWAALAGSRYRVPDVVDLYDPDLTTAVDVLEDYGSVPTQFGGLCGGVAALRGVLEQAGIGFGNLVLLRIMGHGNHGHQAIAYGTGNHILAALRGDEILSFRELERTQRERQADENERSQVLGEMRYSSLSYDFLQEPELWSHLREISPLFAPCGCIEFHGCRVGSAEKGQWFLQGVANIVGVPAVASLMKQRLYNAVRYRGPLALGIPGGATLKRWAGSLQALEGYV